MILFFLCADTTSELRLHRPRAERQHAVRLLLTRGAARHLPGPGYGGHRQGHAMELCVHSGLRGELRGKWRGRIHSEVEGGR